MREGFVRADDAELRSALSASGLPIDDLDEGGAAYFVLPEGDSAVAFGGIAGSGPDRLLRSVVVPEAGRGLGYGARIVSHLIDTAVADKATRLWLLTTDAGSFFARLGWQPIDRDAAPDAIRSTRQFASICPASATLMVRELGG